MNQILNTSQFLYHGTARPIEGDKILPASVHGKGSYWGNTGHTRGEPSENHAWAIGDEHQAWGFALDRADFDLLEHPEDADGHPVSPRARVYAVHPNEHMSAGGDTSVPGEIKAPHFDIAHPLDIQPGHQGTFPGVNWNRHVDPKTYLPGDEDANHPSDESIKYGHRLGVWGAETANARLHEDARQDDIHQRIDRQNAVVGNGPKAGPPPQDTMLPGMSKDGRRYQENRHR